jgi:DNA-directed RNA polymerase II subunit RPB1
MEDSNLESIVFSIPSVNEIVHSISVVEVTNPMSTVEFGTNNTLYDTRMGAFRNVRCGTCKGTSIECNGHHGRIKLAYPCVNTGFIDTVMRSILANFCMACFRHLKRCECVETENASKKRKRSKPKLVKLVKVSNGRGDNKYLQGLKYSFKWADAIDDSHLTIKQVYDLMHQIPRSEFINDFPPFSRFNNITEGPFIHYLLVLPTTSRPPNMMGGTWTQDPISRLYTSVLKKNLLLTMKKDVIISTLVEEYHNQLQLAINILFDIKQTNYKLPGMVVENGGLRQRIDGKEGRLRMNLMGKRTEFSARTVLSGDPKLGINEVGIPSVVANKLTIPILVNRYNIRHIYHYKMKYVTKHDGRRFDVGISKNYRIEIGDIIERCLINGDIVAVNRQPTLHRGSVIACYVKIFDCLTFRLNYSTMITLNADTDGDEINIHVPQDLESRAELENLMLASTNIVSSQSSKPLVGCTQDSLVGCYLLSKEHNLPINDYMSILYEMGCEDADDIINQRSTTPFVKGTRFITVALNHIGMHMARYEPSPDFLIVDNVVQYGLLTKNIIGKSENSIIHHVYLSVGHLKAAKFIHLIQLAANTFLDIKGFSIGISDCIVNHSPLNYNGLEKHLKMDFFKRAGKWNADDEDQLTEALGELTKLEPPKNIDDNRLLDMIQSGAKGTMVNFNQITRVVGQQIEAEGRVSKRFNGGTRTLPHFSKFDPSAGSRGLVKNSFINGLTPHEFFMHAMGGRIGLIDTACKTSETGAQFRRLVKVLEPLITKDVGENKRAVINCITNQVVQFEYGEDSYDGTYLKRLKCSSPT